MIEAAEITHAAERIAAQKRGDEGRPQLAQGELDRLRTMIATEFGRRRGWTYRQHDRVTPGELSDRWTAPDDHHLVDNAYTFRRSDGSPAAVVGHVYNGDREEVRRDLRRQAHRFGLVVSFPTDVPSWWFPGGTTLVLLENPWGRMPVLRPLDDADTWWSIPRREPFGHDEVLSRVLWPSEAESLADIRAMVAEMEGDRSPRTMTIERLHILHDHHPSRAVQLRAHCALSNVGHLDFDGEDDGEAA